MRLTLAIATPWLACDDIFAATRRQVTKQQRRHGGWDGSARRCGELHASAAVPQSHASGRCVLPLGDREEWTAGDWRRSHAQRGITLWQADCLVAAAAKSWRAQLATGNPKDFPNADIDVAHWPVAA